MKILVTGATGFLGSNLCERLVKQGNSVRALVRNPKKTKLLKTIGIEIAKGDLRDFHSLKKAIKGIDIVYNIAAAWRDNLRKEELFGTNVDGTRNILEAAYQEGVKRFVHCSTVGVHGSVLEPPANENSPFLPRDDYQVSKVKGERIVSEYIRENKLPIVIFRPCGIYGPTDTRFLKLFRAIKKHYFFMIGSGDVQYHMIYIDDLIDGILLCGEKDEAIGNVYILGSEEISTIKELVSTISDIMGVRTPKFSLPFLPIYYLAKICEFVFKPLPINPPIYERRINFFISNRAFDISKAKKELGFQPRTDLRTGVIKTYEWYKRSGLL
ncbi:MAG: NAD-dependent epimerase/dehydratase family protein [Candidatus Dadabacteria bacterium]|nr:NAD-dependent epimerase/dehydratase family protein [Candidatus Dadabacteria bacterium]